MTTPSTSSYKTGQGWRDNNLSSLTGAPTAHHDFWGNFDASPRAYATDNDKTARVIYRGQDEHIHELYYTTAGGWGRADLNNRSDAPTAKAAGDPFGYFTSFDSYARVLYRGTDGHIHELFYKTGLGWGHVDLTARTGASDAAGDPTAYLVGNSIRVIYKGTDDQIYQLRYTTAGGWTEIPSATKEAHPSALPWSDPVGTVTATWRPTARVGRAGWSPLPLCSGRTHCWPLWRRYSRDPFAPLRSARLRFAPVRFAPQRSPIDAGRA